MCSNSNKNGEIVCDYGFFRILGFVLNRFVPIVTLLDLLRSVQLRPYLYRIYDKLIIDHPSMWLGSSVDRALYRYRKLMGSNPVQARIFFKLLFQLLKLIEHCEVTNFYRCFDCRRNATFYMNGSCSVRTTIQL